MLTSIICFIVGFIIGYISRIVHINIHVARLIRGMKLNEDSKNDLKGVIGFDTSQTIR